MPQRDATEGEGTKEGLKRESQRRFLERKREPERRLRQGEGAEEGRWKGSQTRRGFQRG